MVDRISTGGALLNDLTLLQSNKLTLDQLQYRLSTGKKFQKLKLYGNDAPRIVDLRGEISARQAYMRSIDLTDGIVRSYDAVLERLSDVASEIINISDPIDADDPDFLNDTQVLADNLMLEIESNLNVRIGDRYIFGGTDFGNAPVKDLRTLALYNDTDIGIPNTDETANQIPEFTVDDGGGGTVQSYHTAHAGSPTNDADAWRETAITINDRQVVNYGLTATNPAFQQLVEAAVRLKSAVQDGVLTVDQRRTMLGEVRTVAETARTELRQLQAQNGAVLNQFDRSRTEHETFIGISQASLEDIEGADSAEAAVQISQLQTQIQASFTTIARRSQLSLVSFLN
jgi:flagellin-like hook-associated protein FlgL